MARGGVVTVCTVVLCHIMDESEGEGQQGVGKVYCLFASHPTCILYVLFYFIWLYLIIFFIFIFECSIYSL